MTAYTAIYAAPPDTAAFRAVHLAELEAIMAEIKASGHTATTEWARSAWECDHRACEVALQMVRGGATVLHARDEDGHYFATR